MVVTGDLTQVDLPSGKRSGLSDAVEVLRGIEGISFVYFDERDVVRHILVQRIVKAYERHQEAIGAGRQLALRLTEPAAESALSATLPGSDAPLPVAPAENREIPLV
jgi:phosphate starvation-inducible protein PhoH and related proteins